MLRSRTSRWSLATLLVSLLTLVAAWFLLVGPQLAEAATLRAEDLSTQQNNDLLEIKISQLEAQAATLESARKDLAAVLQQMPAELDMQRLVRDLNSVAEDTGVDLQGVTPAAEEPVASASSGSGTAPGAAGAAGASGAADSTGSADAAGAGDATGSGSSAKSSGTSTGNGTSVVAIPVSLVVQGDYFQIVAFVQKVQTQLSRAVLISGIDIGEADGDSSDGEVKVTLSARVFVLQTASSASSGSDTAGSSGATPSATATGTPSPTASSTEAPAPFGAGTSSPTPTDPPSADPSSAPTTGDPTPTTTRDIS
jgi:Tfp pilus assembly protein PilO